MELNDIITPTLLLTIGGLMYVIKYVIPKIQTRIEGLEHHKANAVTVEQVKEIMQQERDFIREIILSSILKAENERLRSIK
tara:strand:+ start:561 stop:803 length:243 start_codon:yes stop_codon:yes gene_type:complete